MKVITKLKIILLCHVLTTMLHTFINFLFPLKTTSLPILHQNSKYFKKHKTKEIFTDLQSLFFNHVMLQFKKY